jgi:hypothetical protein
MYVGSRSDSHFSDDLNENRKDGTVFAAYCPHDPHQEGTDMTSTLLDRPYTPDVFLASSNPELRRLLVQETEESIKIEGRVSSYYVKQLAQETLRRVADGRRVINRVLVERRISSS